MNSQFRQVMCFTMFSKALWWRRVPKVGFRAVCAYDCRVKPAAAHLIFEGKCCEIHGFRTVDFANTCVLQSYLWLSVGVTWPEMQARGQKFQKATD